jgi:hypothetical protein
MSNLLLAQVELSGTWPATIKVAIGIIGLLCIASLIFSVVLQSRKLFGRRPPIEDELDKLEKKLHAEVMDSFGRAYKRAEEAHAAAESLSADTDQKFEKLHEDRQRVQENINHAFRNIERGLGRLEGHS